MPKTREQIIQIASEVITNLADDNIEAAIIWGSYTEGRILSDNSDIDLIVIKTRLEIIEDPNIKLVYGVPTLSINYKGSKVDIIYVDTPYLIKALNQNHWTVINALTNGIVIYGENVIIKLQSLLTEFRAFALTTSEDWLNQAANILEKGQSTLDEGDYLGSIILVRHAVDAMMHALIVSELGRPPSPRSFLRDLKDAMHNEDIYNYYLQIQGIQNMNTIDATRINLGALEILNYISSRVRKN